MTSAASSRPIGVLLSRLAWPTAILLAGVLAALFATIVWTSESANQVAMERQKLQMTAALGQKLDDLEERLVQLTSNPGFFGVLKKGAPSEVLFWWQWAVNYFEFSGAFLVSSQGRVEWGMIDALWAGQDAYDQMRPLLHGSVHLAHTSLLASRQQPNPTGKPPKRSFMDSHVLSDGSDVYAIVTLPIGYARRLTNGSERLVAVAYKRLAVEELTKIANLHGVKDFRVANLRPAAHQAALTVYDPAEQPTM
jgi:hypothetical protein